jgi:hypothetical protein
MSNQESEKEFTAGSSITLQMQLTPDQLIMMREWSKMIPTLYMLDICVVSATKLTNASLESNPRKTKLVNYLRELDTPNNCFSYLFALMEKVSDSRGIDTEEKLEEKILSDLFSLRKFFKNSKVFEPDEFVLKFLKELRGIPIENKRNEYLSFINDLNGTFNLSNPVSPKQRLNIAKKIIKHAVALNIVRQHPIVVIGLACLYENPAAKRLMKFSSDSKKFDPENVLADIMLINRFAGIKLEIEQMGRNGSGKYLRNEFITDDVGLIEILKCFTPNYIKHTDRHDGRETQTTITVKLKDLLTEINDEELENIIDLLSQGQVLIG